MQYTQAAVVASLYTFVTYIFFILEARTEFAAQRYGSVLLYYRLANFPIRLALMLKYVIIR